LTIIGIRPAVELVQHLAVIAMTDNVKHPSAEAISINDCGVRLLLVDLLYYLVGELNQVQAAIFPQNPVLSALSNSDHRTVIAFSGHVDGHYLR